MKNVFLTFILHKNLYFFSLSTGAILSMIVEFFVEFTPKYLFGMNVTLWLIALTINVIDIRTGIKADTKKKEDKGEKFVFESGKGWRAIEKIFVFTMIVWFIYSLELEAIRLNAFNLYSQILLYIKFILLIYIVLIEIQSIGENELVRFGKKGKTFILLDQVIEIVNKGILNKIRALLKL